jgi:U4/U6.U5 tri-snRNP-associated protein 3
MKEAPERPEGVDDETWEMMQTMGFGGFKSTKNTKVPGNDRNYGVRRDKQLQARQYMNRQGGFNRPLSPGRG